MTCGSTSSVAEHVEIVRLGRVPVGQTLQLLHGSRHVLGPALSSFIQVRSHACPSDHSNRCQLKVFAVRHKNMRAWQYLPRVECRKYRALRHPSGCSRARSACQRVPLPLCLPGSPPALPRPAAAAASCLPRVVAIRHEMGRYLQNKGWTLHCIEEINECLAHPFSRLHCGSGGV